MTLWFAALQAYHRVLSLSQGIVHVNSTMTEDHDVSSTDGNRDITIVLEYE